MNELNAGVCHECGLAKPDALRMADPYELDVNNQVWMRGLCGPCARKMADCT